VPRGRPDRTDPDVTSRAEGGARSDQHGGAKWACHSQSLIDKEGEVSIRLDEGDRERFIQQYESRISMQYGRQMKEFVVVPDSLLERPDEIRPWFVRSWEWVGALEPK
jgi:hypothetical protein